MAKISPKGKKVNGTNKGDKITWVSSKAWKKALTVLANAGNDVINFKKSKYNNKLYGGNGSDKIYGGSGNDKIYGGKGNDIINAGKGNNKIIFAKGDGKDTVQNGKGVDTLVFSSESTVSAKFVGNNLVLKGKKGKNTVTLKNYGLGDHSAQWVTIGKKTVRTDSLVKKNEISSPTGPNQYIGTPRPDNIIVNGFDDETVINACAGDDIITLIGDNNSRYEEANIDAGSGNDTISLNVARAILKINNKSGSDTIENAGKHYTKSEIIDYIGSAGYYYGSGGYTNDIILDVSENNNILLREGGLNPYILGEQKGNDLILKLTNGETLTIKDYANYDPYSVFVYAGYGSYIGSGGYAPVKALLTTTPPDITYLNKNKRTLDKSSSTEKEIVIAKENANYNVKLGNANYNEVIITADGNHNVQVGNGDDNNVKINAGPVEWSPNATPIKGNVTVVVGNGSSNEIDILTQNNANITTGNGSNYIYVDANEATITTGTGYNDINADSAKSTIISNGNDEIYIDRGHADITLNGAYEEKEIYVAKDASATLNGVMNVDYTELGYTNYYSYNTYYYQNMDEVVFTHYDSQDSRSGNNDEGTGYITVFAKDGNGNLLGGGTRLNGNYIYDSERGYTYFDLDDYDYDNSKFLIDDKLRVRMYDNSSHYYKLSELKQYVDMSMLSSYTTGYAHEFDMENDTLAMASSAYVMGSNDNDFYFYEWNGITIKEKGGDNDWLAINKNTENFRMLFDVDSEGNVGNDIIFADYRYNDGTKDFYKLFSTDSDTRKSALENSLKIQDFFTEDGGTIERITNWNNGNPSETLNSDELKFNGQIIHNEGMSSEYRENSIVADVVAWLGAHSEYTSAFDAIEKCTDSTALSELAKCYANLDNSATTNNSYHDDYYSIYWLY